MVFARKASGLTRGLSMWDAFGIGFTNNGITVSLWTMTTMGLGVYLGGNIIIAAVLSMIFVGIGLPLVWGILGGSMPRSGGEYIYNSRIIHPLVGMAEAFGGAFMLIFWIYVLAPWVANPGLVWLGDIMGWPGVAHFGTNRWSAFFVATVVNVSAFLIVAFGMKTFARVQKVLLFFALGGCIVILVSLSLHSHHDFIQAWNAMATKYHSIKYNAFVSAVASAHGKPIPTTWNWYDTLGLMVAANWCFACAFFITYIAGEVKRPDKSILGASLIAVLVSGVIVIWFGIALYHLCDFQFLSAASWLDRNGTSSIKGYNLPWSTDFLGLLAVVVHNKVILFISILSFLLFDAWWVVLSLMAFPRIIFAFGMDRMGPRWFTAVNARWASPLKALTLGLVLGEAASAVYTLWIGSPLQGLTGTGLTFLTIYGVTSVSAVIFPYRKRVRTIWESSPYRSWNILGVPVVTLAGLVYLAYIAIVLYFLEVMPVNRDFTWRSGILYVIIWSAGIVWFLFWRWSNRRSIGRDLSVATFGELPPE